MSLCIMYSGLVQSLSVYNEDAPRQLLSSLAALGEVMLTPPEQRAFRKKETVVFIIYTVYTLCIHCIYTVYIPDLFIHKLNSSHMKTKPASKRMSFFMAFPETYICMSSLEL